ncbi:hypothetical protein IJG78_04075 [Candidatus Saccharibacteria bacterium]|nr:hypothetical protein [Candidatus Saccharibacteria bacterium]
MEHTSFIEALLTIFFSFCKGALIFTLCLTGLIFLGFIFVCVREGINIYKEDKAAARKNQSKTSHEDALK